MSSKYRSYKELKQDLEQIIEKLNDDDLDIDEALILHDNARDLLVQLDKKLAKTKHTFEIISKKPKK